MAADDPTAGWVIHGTDAQGRQTHGLCVACKIGTLSSSIPTFLEEVRVEVAPIPSKNSAPRFSHLDKVQPLLYIPDDGWTYEDMPEIEVDWPYEGSIIAPPVEAGGPYVRTEPVRLIQVSAVVSTASADTPPERWTSLSVVVVTVGNDFYVERRLPFLRENSENCNQRWNQALEQIRREADAAQN